MRDLSVSDLRDDEVQGAFDATYACNRVSIGRDGGPIDKRCHQLRCSSVERDTVRCWRAAHRGTEKHPPIVRRHGQVVCVWDCRQKLYVAAACVHAPDSTLRAANRDERDGAAIVGHAWRDGGEASGQHLTRTPVAIHDGDLWC